MILLFKKDGTYLFNTGRCSGAPADHSEQLDNNKADYKSTYNLSETDWRETIKVILDIEDPTNKELLTKLEEGYIPKIDVAKATDTNKQEYDYIPTKKEKRVKLNAAGKIVKKKGEIQFEEKIVESKKIRKPFNKNRDALLDIESWEKSSGLVAIEEKKVKKERIKELEQKLLLNEASASEKAEYKTLKNLK